MEGTWTEPLKEKSIMNHVYKILDVEDWRAPIRNFILYEQLPNDVQEARKVRTTVPKLILIEDQIYRIMVGTHERVCGSHIDINVLL